MVEPLWLRVWAWVWSHQLNNFPLSGWFHVNCTLKVQTANKVIKHWHFNVFLFQQQHSYMQLQCNFSMQMKQKKSSFWYAKFLCYSTFKFYVSYFNNSNKSYRKTLAVSEWGVICDKEKLSEIWVYSRSMTKWNVIVE